MESSASLPTMVVSVNINCCKACQKKVKNSLFKVEGVHSITMEAEKKLVSVVGKANPTKVLEAISKIGKKAELLSYEKEPRKDNKCSNDTADETMDKKTYIKENIRQIGRNKIFCRDDEYDAKSYHKVEGYIPLPVDERSCRDPFCRAHNRYPYVYKLSSLEDHGDAQRTGCTIM